MNAALLLALSLSFPPEGPSHLPLLLEENFEKGDDKWRPTDAKAWKIIDENGNKRYNQHAQSQYKPPHRSPFNFSLYKDAVVKDFVLTAKCKNTHKDVAHRDMCIIFNYQDPAHYYYVHIAKKTDDHAHNIFIVNDAPRLKISTKTSQGIEWADQWHDVKVVRDTASGKIEIYFDDMKTPIMTAEDKTFTWGQVGIGSFDDTGLWDDIKLYGTTK